MSIWNLLTVRVVKGYWLTNVAYRVISSPDAGPAAPSSPVHSLLLPSLLASLPRTQGHPS